MPVQVGWDEHCRQCIYFTINGGWVWQDFQTAMVTVHDLSDATEQAKLDYIFDVRDTRIFPRDGLHRIRRMRLQLSQKARLMVVVGQGIFADALMQLLERMASGTEICIVHVKSLDEAYTRIEAYHSVKSY